MPAILRVASLVLPAVAAILLPVCVNADGGVVRVRETQGPFIVTIFSPAQVAAGIPTDLTVMVQKSGTAEIVMDATVDVSVSAPSGARIQPGDPFCTSLDGTPSPGMVPGGSSSTFRATPARATNKLLYGLPLILRAPGIWNLRASVRQGAESAFVTCALPVEATSRRLWGLWFCVALPPCLIGLFVLNQGLRRSSVVALHKID